jgi:uncharacterized membrane protein YkoI
MRTPGPAIGLMLALVLTVPAHGAERFAPLWLIADPEMAPLASVLKKIEARIPGRALDAKVREGGETTTYRVKWLGEDGKVREITADARSGKILKVR